MAKVLKLGDPTELAIVADSIDEVFISRDDGKVLTVWLRGGQVQTISHQTEEDCRKSYDQIVKTLEDL